MVNDVLVARDGTIYVATTCGLTWSKDRGATWTYLRGRDWADKVRNRFGGPPQGWSPSKAGTLLQDYVTCLAEDADGSLYIGHRAEGWATFDAAAGKCSKRSAGADGRSFVNCILPPEQGAPFIGTYGSGPQHLERTSAGGAIAVSPHPSTKTMPHPSDAQAPRVTALAKTIAKATAGERDQSIALFLRDDWLTQGDWVGRYGRPYALLCGAESPLDTYINYARVDYKLRGAIGPHCAAGDGLRHWLQDLRSGDPRVLWNPTIGTRRLAAWDDHGEAYPGSPGGTGPSHHGSRSRGNSQGESLLRRRQHWNGQVPRRRRRIARRRIGTRSFTTDDCDKDDAIAIALALADEPKGGLSVHRGGNNVLFGDCHAELLLTSAE